ncbi:MAG: type II toxin-antitoxin system VapC family toxin [Thermodesulfobacteriota bacterium]|nr:type II toxin-antitoxin system VapC family toxin [Thermodesulfobacteriota bacterium]
MKILLDTHAFLWWITDDPQLSKNASALIVNSSNYLYWSSASSWEVAIKYSLGRLPLPDSPSQFIMEELEKNQIESLPITDYHAFSAGMLPLYHKDPFDRMLIAQAINESMILLSCDTVYKYYDVNVCW